ncbi:hypothetical protein GGR39_002331 [Novosphingobium fluoreni]|uniref:Uncharacterized protein n=1 Tax=Novosphingobium fluoreni TaxID=1391222 RepID=A0A7W6C2Z7_9SPHN|nr:hypothetical protein [Novosphingobium fluoreni]MBB3940674.1 hypothetical protein [Novosphingobium fluoreni]
MNTEQKQAALMNVQREIGRIAAGGGTFQDITKATDYRAFTPAPKDARLKIEGRTKTGNELPSFGRWLLVQPATGLRAALITAAKADRQFPLDGTADDVRARLSACGAEGDMFEALDDAELDWCAL